MRSQSNMTQMNVENAETAHTQNLISMVMKPNPNELIPKPHINLVVHI